MRGFEIIAAWRAETGGSSKDLEKHNIERVRLFLESNLGCKKKEVIAATGLNPRTVAKAIRYIRGEGIVVNKTKDSDAMNRIRMSVQERFHELSNKKGVVVISKESTLEAVIGNNRFLILTKDECIGGDYHLVDARIKKGLGIL